MFCPATYIAMVLQLWNQKAIPQSITSYLLNLLLKYKTEIKGHALSSLKYLELVFFTSKAFPFYQMLRDMVGRFVFFLRYLLFLKVFFYFNCKSQAVPEAVFKNMH